MKTSMKIAVLAASTLLFAGCASQSASDADMAALKTSVQEARAAAVQAQQTSQQALQISQSNADKINRVFMKSQMK